MNFCKNVWRNVAFISLAQLLIFAFYLELSFHDFGTSDGFCYSVAGSTPTHLSGSLILEKQQKLNVMQIKK